MLAATRLQLPAVRAMLAHLRCHQAGSVPLALLPFEPHANALRTAVCGGLTFIWVGVTDIGKIA